MAKRKFKLPGIQDLSKEQEDVRAIPLPGQHLIIGGPGTGKSVMALLRAKRLSAEKKDYVFLVYNKLLRQASDQLFAEVLNSAQWQSWFEQSFLEETGQVMPKFPAKTGTFWREPNWGKALEVIQSSDNQQTGKSDKYLVIDEGQDMPPGFYQALASMGYSNFFVVADQNQQIVSGSNSSREDIENALAIETDAVIELKLNYRNKYAIARLAREFYTGDPASPPPELPVPTLAATRKPLLFSYEHRQFNALIARVLKVADRDPSKLLGVITPNNNVRVRYMTALKEVDVNLDNGRPSINTFQSGDSHIIPFDEGGVVIINAQACKGLEFDVVFVADVDQFRMSAGAEDATKKLFYVIVARAIDQVILLRQKTQHCVIENILPTDTDILEKK